MLNVVGRVYNSLVKKISIYSICEERSLDFHNSAVLPLTLTCNLVVGDTHIYINHHEVLAHKRLSPVTLQLNCTRINLARFLL